MAHGAKPTQDDKQTDKKLVKATELPIHGNPYPPKDVVENNEPGFLESKVINVRTTLQPYLSPFNVAYEKTSDFLSVGLAHSQNAFYQLRENQSTIGKALIISASGLVGVGLARRRGIFKKIIFGSTAFGGAIALCYPNESEEKAQMLWYIAKNKLPGFIQQQYQKLSGNESSPEKKE